MLDLLAEQQVPGEEVNAITVSTSRRNATILRNAKPQTGLEAKFSMQFAMASSIIAGRVGLTELTDGFVQRQDVQALIGRVKIEPDDRPDPERSGAAPFDQVIIELHGGRRLESRRVTDERGSPQLPLSNEELWAKFEACLALGNPRLPARQIFDALLSIEHQPGVGAFVGVRQAA
jgi:2-methylcitrate dehydratase PrpD